MSVQKLIAEAEKLLEKKKVPEAVAKLTAAQLLDPHNQLVTSRLANSYLELGDRASAARVYVELAERLSDLGKIPLALATFKQALEVTPENVELKVRFARECELAGKSGDAQKHADAALQYYLRRKKYLDAIGVLSILVRLQPRDERLKLAWIEIMQMGASEGRLVHLLVALAGPPGLASNEFPTGGDAATLSDAQYEGLRRLVDFFPRDPRVAYTVAWAALRRGRRRDFYASLRESIRRQPDFCLSYLLLARVLGEDGRLAEARFVFQHAKGRAPVDRLTDLSALNRQIEACVEKVPALLDQAVDLEPTAFLASLQLPPHAAAPTPAPTPTEEPWAVPEIENVASSVSITSFVPSSGPEATPAVAEAPEIAVPVATVIGAPTPAPEPVAMASAAPTPAPAAVDEDAVEFTSIIKVSGGGEDASADEADAAADAAPPPAPAAVPGRGFNPVADLAANAAAAEELRQSEATQLFSPMDVLAARSVQSQHYGPVKTKIIEVAAVPAALAESAAPPPPPPVAATAPPAAPVPELSLGSLESPDPGSSVSVSAVSVALLDLPSTVPSDPVPNGDPSPDELLAAANEPYAETPSEPTQLFSPFEAIEAAAESRRPVEVAVPPPSAPAPAPEPAALLTPEPANAPEPLVISVAPPAEPDEAGTMVMATALPEPLAMREAIPPAPSEDATQLVASPLAALGLAALAEEEAPAPAPAAPVVRFEPLPNLAPPAAVVPEPVATATAEPAEPLPTAAATETLGEEVDLGDDLLAEPTRILTVPPKLLAPSREATRHLLEEVKRELRERGSDRPDADAMVRRAERYLVQQNYYLARKALRHALSLGADAEKVKARLRDIRRIELPESLYFATSTDQQARESADAVIERLEQDFGLDEDQESVPLGAQFTAQVEGIFRDHEPRTVLDFGVALHEMGLYRDAEELFTRVSAAYPEHAFDAYYLAAVAKYSRRDYAGAVSILEKLSGDADKSEADKIQIYYALGELFEKMQRLDGAKEFFRKVAELDSNYRNVRNKLEG